MFPQLYISYIFIGLSFTADNFTLNSGDNTQTRCMTSVLLIPQKEFVMDNSQVSFDYHVDSRNCRSPGYLGCDGLAFYIDNQRMLDFQGNQFQWSTKTYNLTVVNNHSFILCLLNLSEKQF